MSFGLRSSLTLARTTQIKSHFASKATGTRRLATMATNPSTYKLNHTMLRVKDPAASIKFYEYLGLSVVNKWDIDQFKFSLIFLSYNGPNALQKGQPWTDRQGVIELTHNWGSENDPNFKIANGNSEPGKGFGHLCVSVDNIQAACKRLEDAGYKFQKKLTDGRMKNIAFALDPDGYWVEIIGQKELSETENVTATDTSSYRMNHTMLRVKDIEKSLNFYQEKLGMELIRTRENPDNEFNLYFLAYTKHENVSQAFREGILELTWNYGTEKDPNFKYHNGNDEPQGFGHLCVSVDDFHAACKRFEDQKVAFKKRPEDGKMRGVAFILDPDGYSIEVIQNLATKNENEPTFAD